MATAGRILIMPKGTWNAETTYENLDMVAHSGRAWLAKKVSVGIEPSDANAEFWHDFLGMDVFTEANPPTAAQAGAVSLYADPVLSKSTDWDNLERGTYRFSTWGGSGGVGYPPIDDVGICILFDTEVGRYMYCLGMNRIVSRYYESKTWSDWIEGYLPLTGGTLSGDLSIENSSQPGVHLKRLTNNSMAYLMNEQSGLVNLGLQYVSTEGYTRSRNLLIWDDTAKPNLKDAFQFQNQIGNYWAKYNIFGEHNKPEGSYTGNGSATSRTITTGGIGKCLMIYGNGSAGIVMPNGAIFIKGTTIKSFGSGHMTYGDGVLTINTDDEMVNANGKTFGYEVK